MDVNENCNGIDSDSMKDCSNGSSVTETDFSENSNSPTSSSYEVKRKRSSCEELCSKLLKTDSVANIDDLAAGEVFEANVSSNSTADTRVTDAKMEDASSENLDDGNKNEKMDDDFEKMTASTSDQFPKGEHSSSCSSSSSSSSNSTSLSTSSDEDTTLSDCTEENEMNDSDTQDSDADDDFNVVSWNLGMKIPFNGDSDSSGEEQKKVEKSAVEVPKVLEKTLPAEKFSFLGALFERQVGGDDPKRRRLQRFENKVYASRRMVQHLKLYKSLQKHTGCVNCASFNDSGEILISASDDKNVCLWDWSRNKSLLFYDSGHLANVFQAKFLPFSNDTKLITCGQDGQIRMSLLDQCGLRCTCLITKHDRTVHKIALQPQMPNTFLSAGEDGVVYSIDIREPKPIYSKLLKMVGNRASGTTCLYSIHCNPLKNYEFVVCGNDKDIRIFDQRRICQENSAPVLTFCPNSLLTDENTGSRKYSRSVTCAMFSYNGSEVLGSYNDNDVYLFDATAGKEIHHYDGHRNFATIKGVNFFGPRSEYIVSGSDCGYVYIWDKDSEAIVQWVKGDDNIVNCLESHPSFPVLATGGLDSDVKIWMPISDEAANVRELKEFIKVTRKNHFYKINNFARFPGRSLVVPLIIDPENVAFQEARSRLPVILRYRRTLRAVLQRRNQRTRSSSDDDTPSDRDCEFLF